MTDKLRAMLEEAVLQLEYLNEKEQRGTTNAVITRARAALAAMDTPKGIGRADNMPLADMARAEAFRTLARCIRDPAQPRKMGLLDLEGVLAWEERRIAALAAAPQPAPDREALVEVIDAHVFNALGETSAEAIADALLARGLRLPGGDETMAWAVVGEDGEVIPGSIYPTRDEAERVCDYEGERVVPVTIRVVEGGDDAA